MKEKLINLIKKYRAASEKRWHPVHGYKNQFEHGQSNAYDRLADDLEGLVRHLSEASTRPEKPFTCGYYTNINCLLRLEDCGKHCPRYLPPA